MLVLSVALLFKHQLQISKYKTIIIISSEKSCFCKQLFFKLFVSSLENVFDLGVGFVVEQTDSISERIINYLEGKLFNGRENHNPIRINEGGIDARYRRYVPLRLHLTVIQIHLQFFGCRCRGNSYDLPVVMKVAVIITYFNETQANLFSTILSVVRKTTRNHLAEVIVIDDCSNNGKWF